MDIIVGKSPNDVTILDDSGNKIDLPFRRITLNLEGGVIPVATLEVEMFREGSLEIERFDLLKRTYHGQQMVKVEA